MSIIYNIHEAKTHFSKLVAAVERGEHVTICRNGAPVIECRPVARPSTFPFGAWQTKVGSLAHLADPTEDDVLDAMGLDRRAE